MDGEIITDKEMKYANLIFWIEKNDSKSFRLLYDASSKHLLFYAYRFVKNRQIAEEVVQETFASIWLHANRYNADMGSPIAWMRKIAKNKALDAIRVSEVYMKNEKVEEIDHQGATTFLEPEAILSEKQSSFIVMTYLRRLSCSQMEVIYLSYYDGLSHSEVASLVEEPLGTVKNRIRLGILRLRRKQFALQEAYPLSQYR